MGSLMEGMKVKLYFPLSLKTNFGLKTILIEEVTVRRPKVKDLEGLNIADPYDQKPIKTYISRLTGIPLELIDDLDHADFISINNAIAEVSKPPSRRL